MKIQYHGNKTAAARWLTFAQQQLERMKAMMVTCGLSRMNKKIPLLGVDIFLKSSPEEDLIEINAPLSGFLIICYVGDTTGDFSSKRFYDDTGKEIARDEPGYPGPLPASPAGWTLVDDGLYGPEVPPDPLDPWNMTYTYNPGGLGIPKSGSGISPKKQAGKSVRYILDGAIEDETFEAWAWSVGGVYTYHFVRQVDSLAYAPYSIYGPRPFFARYLGDKVVTMIVPWSGYDTTFTWDAYNGDNFRDRLPKVHRIWSVSIADASKTYVDVDDYGDDSDAVIGAAGFRTDDATKVRILRTKTENWGGSLMAEPVSDETYDLTASTLTLNDEYHRCADPASSHCYFLDGRLDSGLPDTGSTIGDDVILPHGINASGQKTYVRMQKSGNFASVNTGVYCADALVEESGWEAVTKIFDGELYGPLLIRNTRYRIIHVHSDSAFNAVVYSKTVHVSHDDELLPYRILRGSPYGFTTQVRKTVIRSLTTYHLSVNGVITDLGYSNYRLEYRLLAGETLYTGGTLIASHIPELPWVDAGYDAVGTPLVEDNSVVMRCDTNSAKGKLFVGFDVYPVAYRHDLVYDAHNNLTLEFDETVMTYPPSSDAQYADVKDRQWMIFATSGQKIKDIAPPQKPSAGGHVPRINGLAFIGA